MNHKNKLKHTLLIGLAEIAIGLGLIAYAPHSLNSKKPVWGFAIWMSVPTILTGSGVYAAQQLVKANQARNIFINSFPQYAHLGISEFWGLSPNFVTSQIELLKVIQNTEPILELNISLFEILEQINHEQN